MNKYLTDRLVDDGDRAIYKWRGWYFAINRHVINYIITGHNISMTYASFDMPKPVEDAIRTWMYQDYADLDIYDYLDKMFPEDFTRANLHKKKIK